MYTMNSIQQKMLNYTAACTNMDESHIHGIVQKRSERKEYMMYNSIYKISKMGETNLWC